MSNPQNVPGWGQPQPQPLKPPSKRPGCLKLGLALIGVAFVLGIIVTGVKDAASSGSTTTATSSAPVVAPTGGASTQAAPPATQTAPTQAATTQAAQETVTYIVNGASDAAITYGPSGSNWTGHSPMKVTQPLGNAQFYSITVQLQGSGSATCEIDVDGKKLSTGTVNGGYNLATCEITKDPFSGQWQDTNSG